MVSDFGAAVFTIYIVCFFVVDMCLRMLDGLYSVAIHTECGGATWGWQEGVSCVFIA